MRTLDFKKEPVQVITLDELKSSQLEKTVEGLPVGKIFHYDLIEQVFSIAQDNGLCPEIDEIFVADNRSLLRPGVTVNKEIEKSLCEGALEAHCFRRVYTTISLHSAENEEFVENICIAYHQKGIQIAVGPNVKICHNQTILGGHNLISNYTLGGYKMPKEQMTIEYMMNVVSTWASNIGTHFANDMKIMDIMRSLVIPASECLEVFGFLLGRRVITDMCQRSVSTNLPYPLNEGQINKSMLRFVQSYKNAFDTKKALTYYDVYNILNYDLKPMNADIPTILPQSVSLFQALAEIMARNNGFISTSEDRGLFDLTWEEVDFSQIPNSVLSNQ